MYLYASLVANVILFCTLLALALDSDLSSINEEYIERRRKLSDEDEVYAGSKSGRRLRSNSLWEAYTQIFAHAKYIDLTHAFSPNIPIWDGFGPPKFSAAVAGTNLQDFIAKTEPFTYAQHGFQADQMLLTTHQLGTQLDPPAHWNEFGATASDLPPTFALRPLCVVDISSKCTENDRCSATVKDIEEYEKRNSRIPAGAVVFFRSDWSKGWESYKTEGAPEVFPSVELETLQFLHEQRHILFHGHEPLDTDMTPTLAGEAWLMHNNYAQAEGVANLDQVAESGCLLSTGFSKIQGGLGTLAHFVAICPEDSKHGVTIKSVPGAPLAKQKFPLRRGKDGVMRPDSNASPIDYCREGGHPLGCDLHTRAFVWEVEEEKQS